jgi:hypothetical protein
MSEYVEIDTHLTDASLLVAALEDLGFPRDVIEIHATAVPLEGYRGDEREQRAEIVIRRLAVGRSSNDLGFARQSDGTFRAIISEYDQRTAGSLGFAYDRAFLGRLTQRYGLRKIVPHYQAQGYRVSVQQLADGTLHVQAER